MKPSEWEAFLAGHPHAHLLQSSAWGELKASFGWEVVRFREGEAGAQVLFRRLPFGRSIAYIPKGPVGPWVPALLPALDQLCRERKAFLLKVEPDEEETAGARERLVEHGFRPGRQTVQPRRTLVVDLGGSEDDLLARMHQKTRYNIGLASRRGVTIHPWDDLEAFGEMMRGTAARNQFGAHAPAYYRRAYDLFHPSGKCEMFVAEVEKEPVAALMAFAQGQRAWYFFGASTDRERQRMPTYLLQWEAMRWARARGCREYDLWGIPDAQPEKLEAEFASRSDGLWGVYRFKRGFGGRLVRTLGAWDRPYSPILYAAYRRMASSLEGA
jgi:lipid II:glycine glycyltransferase (peptidoglycan interpeptide bridge formation enzyme)